MKSEMVGNKYKSVKLRLEQTPFLARSECVGQSQYLPIENRLSKQKTELEVNIVLCSIKNTINKGAKWSAML